MSELYWLTRLGNINTFFFTLFIVSIIITIIYTIISLCVFIEDKDNAAFKKLKIPIISTLVSGMICCLIPTTKEMFIIYGIGGTIDYLKSNDTAKQLPDKCIKALDKWADEYTLEEKQNKEK